MQVDFIADELVVPRRRPRRSLMARFVRGYPVIVGLFACLILALSTLRYAPALSIIFVAGYWLYHGLKRQLQKRKHLRSIYRSHAFQLGRSVILIIAMSAFIGYLYRYTSYLRTPGNADTLWLMLLLGTLISSQRGSTLDMLISLAAASVGVIATELLAAPVLGPSPSIVLLTDIAVKILWLALMSLILHLLIRYVVDLYADFELVHELEECILESEERAIAAQPDRPRTDFLQEAVDRVSRDFDYPHVNILLSERGVPVLAAASCEAGKQLAKTQYAITAPRSIVKQVLVTGRPYGTNEAEKDPLYLAHPLFTHTRSELAVPLRWHSELIGVLDLQAHFSGAFFEQDLKVMDIVARQIARALGNSRAHWARRQYARVINAIAGRLLSQHDLPSTLRVIADSAREALTADIVVLYERNAHQSRTLGPFFSGEPRHRDLQSPPSHTSGGLVARLIAGAQTSYYQSAAEICAHEPPFYPDDEHGDPGYPNFADREGIQARGILKLMVGNDCVGLIFANYRRAQVFDLQIRTAFETFGNLAALAIRQAQFNERELELQRLELVARIHDSLGSAVQFARDGLLAGLAEAHLLSPKTVRGLEGAQQALAELSRDMKFLKRSNTGVATQPLNAALDSLITLVRSIYNIDVCVTAAGRLDQIPSHLAVQVRLILNEALANAVTHSHATNIDVSVIEKDGQLDIKVADNGEGFSMTYVRPQGLDHMRERAARLGGTCTIASRPGQGTSIDCVVPCGTPAAGGAA